MTNPFTARNTQLHYVCQNIAKCLKYLEYMTDDFGCSLKRE